MSNLCLIVLAVVVAVCFGHPSYLKDSPNLNDAYFSKWGVGAVGHTGGVSGAKLNKYGEAFKHAGCSGIAADDDDDDDDDHHKKAWKKLCCLDSDGDGQRNGIELGDPCCVWKYGGSSPISGYNVSHPGMYTEKTTESGKCPTGDPCNGIASTAFDPDTHPDFSGVRAAANYLPPDGDTTPLTAFVTGQNAKALLLMNSSSSAWVASSPDLARLIWIRSTCVLRGYSGAPWQALNHLPNDQDLANKARLHRSLLNNLSPHQREFLLETLPLTNAADVSVVKQTLTQIGTVGPWILKPADMSKGVGVELLPHPRDWAIAGGASDALASGPHVVQRYLASPLLLEGFKSEVRVYFLVASVHPLRVLWFPEGSVRLALRSYDSDNWDDLLVHVLNTAAAKRELGEAKYKKLASASPRKWTYAKFAAHLRASRTSDSDSDPWNRVQQQMKQAIATVMRVYAAKTQSLRSDSGPHRFALLGADFLIDTNLKAWLLEIQEGPGLSHDDNVKMNFVPRLAAQAAHLGAKAAMRLFQGESLNGLEDGTDFELLLTDTQI